VHVVALLALYMEIGMRVITSIARGVGSSAGWLAATAVAAGSSALDQLGESGEVLAESYESSYDARSAYLEMTPAERKAARAQVLQAKREALAAKAPAGKPTKKLVTA
jgi:DNA-binding MarR family transcriptional regulator